MIEINQSQIFVINNVLHIIDLNILGNSLLKLYWEDTNDDYLLLS